MKNIHNASSENTVHNGWTIFMFIFILLFIVYKQTKVNNIGE